MATGLWMVPAAALVLAQAPAPPAPGPHLIENTGKPMRIPLTCGNEKLEALALTCPAEQPCPVFLELSGFEAAGNRLFAAGNLHTESATIESVLLASDDAGKTWYEPYPRMPQTGLDQVRFADLEAGWVSGEVLAALPRDPFFLITRDGGKTWHAQPVTAESRAGTIEWFEFSSRTNGSLWIDRAQAAAEGSRWEAYETTTGGDVWVLREMTDKAPKLAKVPGPAGWRIRADAASKSYRIEKQAGGRWVPAASFLVRVGECKEQEQRLPEAPPKADEPPGPKPAGER